jgi:hypothetical protein
MPVLFRKRIFRAVFWFAALFVLLFLFRFLYGFYNSTPTYSTDVTGSDFFSSLNNLRKNYASEKLSNNITGIGSAGSTDLSGTQKYEKTATVSSGTAQFEADDSLIRKTTDSFMGSIQYEQSLGKKGSRELYLSVGVKPSAFDSFYHVVQGIGKLRSTTITKIDRPSNP